MFFVDGMKPDGRKNKDTMTAIHTYTVVASCNGVVVYTWNCTSHKEAQGIVNYVTAQRKWNHLDRVTVKEA